VIQMACRSAWAAELSGGRRAACSTATPAASVLIHWQGVGDPARGGLATERAGGPGAISERSRQTRKAISPGEPGASLPGPARSSLAYRPHPCLLDPADRRRAAWLVLGGCHPLLQAGR